MCCFVRCFLSEVTNMVTIHLSLEGASWVWMRTNWECVRLCTYVCVTVHNFWCNFLQCHWQATKWNKTLTWIKLGISKVYKSGHEITRVLMSLDLKCGHVKCLCISSTIQVYFWLVIINRDRPLSSPNVVIQMWPCVYFSRCQAAFLKPIHCHSCWNRG